MNISQDIIEKIRNQISISDLISHKVVWDKKKTNAGRGDFWAPCPFHSEKTASFHVDEAKGYYYCFGCHKKGDSITFKMESENLSFIEAVTLLAEESGVNLPDNRYENFIDHTKPLKDIVTVSATFFVNQLTSPLGKSAQDYLNSRELSKNDIDEFQLGFAPKTSNLLLNYLKSQGYAVSDIIKAGMAFKSEKNGEVYDRFQNRLMFPITDKRGKPIAFGARAMNSEQHAKYLNSPETPIFGKGNTIYNFSKARTNFKKGSKLILVEGYMDVIKLSKYGFKSVVAPLGTAITSRQLGLLWEISSEPIIMMDGDSAGLRAAKNLIDILLPIITFENTVRFCFLPKNIDPDDFLGSQGPEALTEIISKSKSLSECIWKREIAGLHLDSPERIASLDNRLKLLVKKIQQPDLRREYFKHFQKLRASLLNDNKLTYQQFRDSHTQKKSKYGAPFKPTEETKNSVIAKKKQNILVGTDQLVQNLIEIESFILALTLFNGGVDQEVFEKLAAADFQTKTLSKIKKQVTDRSVHAIETATILADTKTKELRDQLRKFLTRNSVLANDEKFVKNDRSELVKTLMALLEKQKRSKSLVDEFKDAREEIIGVADESLTLRLREAHEAFQNFSNSLDSHTLNLKENSQEDSKVLKKFIDDKIWKKT